MAVSIRIKAVFKREFDFFQYLRAKRETCADISRYADHVLVRQE